jgi:hypothetical protein
MGALELYEQAVKQMPSSERLRLASLILNDLVPVARVDEDTAWTAQDLADATLASLARLDRETGYDDAQTW